jgi:WS/DGAT/MGAT family acyltransferase
VWVDDDHFNLTYHLRHTALPPPGDLRQLKRLTGRIMSQQLDRGKPLWEMWFVEGLDDGRFAVITKVHHCMIDGVSGVDLLAGMITAEASHPHEAPPHWVPRPAPGPGRMLADELMRRATLPLDIARGAGALLSEPRRTLQSTREALQALGEALSAGFSPASATPLNCDIGPHRRFDWLRVDLDDIKQIKHAHGTTLNDVVLAIVAGAMRRFLRTRGEQVDDLEFRAMVPVNVRAAAEHGRLGNRVSFLLAPLPVNERGAVQRLASVAATMGALKRSKQRQGGELLEEISDHTATSLFARFARLGARARPYNIVVTNVPGPPFSVALQGAALSEIYPLVPLFSNQALGIALFSYNGSLYWGFNADWDAVPDLHEVVLAVEQEFNELLATAAPPHAARAERSTPAVRPVPPVVRAAGAARQRRAAHRAAKRRSVVRGRHA